MQQNVQLESLRHETVRHEIVQHETVQLCWSVCVAMRQHLLAAGFSKAVFT